MFTVELLPAAHGDGIWIEYGDRLRPHRVLIDGGPASTYEGGLRNRMARAMAAQGSGQLAFELYVITHIDADHIDVPLIFLRDEPVKCTFGDIWFNGFAQIAPKDDPNIFGPLQGEFLTSILGDKSKKLPWNTAAKSRAVGVPPTGKMPTVELAGGMKLTLVSPGEPELKRLRARWEAAIVDFTPGDLEEARKRLAARRDYKPPELPPVFGGRTLGNDRTPANGSSIAMVAEFEGRSILLTGDAHAKVLAENLRRLATERGKPTVRLDAFKLAHHGSMGNITPEVLDAVTCSRFLFSTSGAIFQHPDPETVDLIRKKASAPVELHFNYESPTTVRFKPRAGDRNKAFYGKDGFITVDLSKGG